METKKTKVATDVAMSDLREFLKKNLPKEFRRGKLDDEKIKEEYIDVLESIEDGNLIFGEKGELKYTLYTPLYSDAKDQSLVKKEVGFRSRIKGADRIILMDGIDPKKDLGTYMIKVISYICQLSITEVKQLEKEDFAVLNQICSVF